MKPFIVIIFFLNMSAAAHINQKMVISADIETQEAARTLYELEKFFQENSTANALRSEYHLALEMEPLEDYILVVIKPIQNVVLKNKLKLLLQARYPEAFYVPNNEEKKQVALQNEKTAKVGKDKYIPIAKNEPIPVPHETIVPKGIVKSDSIIDGIVNEWLALVILALAGLLLVYRSNRQINKIKTLQKKLERYQEKIETQMDHMGEQYE